MTVAQETAPRAAAAPCNPAAHKDIMAAAPHTEQALPAPEAHGVPRRSANYCIVQGSQSVIANAPLADIIDRSVGAAVPEPAQLTHGPGARGPIGTFARNFELVSGPLMACRPKQSTREAMLI